MPKDCQKVPELRLVKRLNCFEQICEATTDPADIEEVIRDRTSSEKPKTAKLFQEPANLPTENIIRFEISAEANPFPSISELEEMQESSPLDAKPKGHGRKFRSKRLFRVDPPVHMPQM